MRHHTSLHLYAPVHILYMYLSIPSVAHVLMDSLFLNQKISNNIRISYLLKYKHSEKEYIPYEK